MYTFLLFLDVTNCVENYFHLLLSLQLLQMILGYTIFNIKTGQCCKLGAFFFRWWNYPRKYKSP